MDIVRDTNRQLVGPSSDLNYRLLRCIYLYDLSLEDFFICSVWSGNQFGSDGVVTGFCWCVNVSDTFGLAFADAEEITEDNIDLFEKVCQWAYEREVEYKAPLLFVVKLRNKMPLYRRESLSTALLEELLEKDFE